MFNPGGKLKFQLENSNLHLEFSKPAGFAQNRLEIEAGFYNWARWGTKCLGPVRPVFPLSESVQIWKRSVSRHALSEKSQLIHFFFFMRPDVKSRWYIAEKVQKNVFTKNLGFSASPTG